MTLLGNHIGVNAKYGQAMSGLLVQHQGLPSQWPQQETMGTDQLSVLRPSEVTHLAGHRRGSWCETRSRQRGETERGRPIYTRGLACASLM